MAKAAFNAAVFYGSPVQPGDELTLVTVTNLSGGSNSLWADRAGTISRSNPFQIDTTGVILFYADEGRYNITATRDGETITWENVILLEDPPADVDLTVPTQQLTGNRTLTSADLGRHFYVLPATSSAITITVPAGLGNGFHCSFFHEGSGTFTVAGSGVTVEEPAGGTLILPTGGYASLIVFGSDALIKLIGLTT